MRASRSSGETSRQDVITQLGVMWHHLQAIEMLCKTDGIFGLSALLIRVDGRDGMHLIPRPKGEETTDCTMKGRVGDASV